MARRNEKYDEIISRKLHQPRYAQAYLQTLMEGEEGISPEEALREVIELMGITEFSKLANVPKPRVSEFLRDVHEIKPATLDRFLKPFGLKTRIVFEKLKAA